MLEFDISVGRSRHEKNWKVAHYEWAQFCFKLSKTHRTAETYKEYLASAPDRQDEIKDIGGFVGGVINGGRRKKGSVLSRQLVTLDADKAPLSLWGGYVLEFDHMACLYSTHKHDPVRGPRYRLIIPLDREVMTDEYEAIGRWLAGAMGIEYFDPTTFQAERLMYWPSTAADGIYEFQQQDGPVINADWILSQYRDWHDLTQWPRHEGEDKAIREGIKVAEDPLEKPGMIGAFCRAHTIEDVIEKFLGAEYTLVADGRYTYTHGSTSGGLVVYQDKWAYSHHATDPASGKLCNAFDLVRLHKFGTKDRDYEGDGYKTPSYDAMIKFCEADLDVITQRGAELLAEFDEVIDIDWTKELKYDKKLELRNIFSNICLILLHDPKLKGAIAYDLLQHRPVVLKNLPWRKLDPQNRFLNDRDLHQLEQWIEKVYHLTTGSDKLLKSLSAIYEKTKFHPILDYLKGLKWDGMARLDALFIDYMGAEDSEYTRAVTRKTLAAAVARVFEPGIKFDSILTLVGEQGKGKSTIISALGRQWFSDTFSLHMLQGKEGYEQMRGVWIIEIGEMAGMAKAEIERIKGFVASRVDRYRVAYGHLTEDFPRQCIFMGSTNKVDFLRDQSGNRRFWPVMINPDKVTKNIFTQLSSKDVDQIWAEAAMVYHDGEPLYLDDSTEDEAKIIQREHTEIHPWYPLISEYLKVKLPENWGKLNRYERLAFLQGGDELALEGKFERDRVCLLEVWNEALNMKTTIDERSAGFIRNILQNIPGWKMENRPIRYGIYGQQRNGYIHIT